MRCDRFRAAISARIDGEDPGLLGGALDAHLRACAGCRAWQERAHVVTRRARLGGTFLDHDLTAQVLAAVAKIMPGSGVASPAGTPGAAVGGMAAVPAGSTARAEGVA
ncbi:MAG TPA: zf-HC2 domain-containing protein [Trebonia sp.]|nr:zf-HC2 domain-containing protein [Trebonia sp.]